MEEGGIAVPGELSIYGFHDIDLSSQMDPPLTTVKVPIEEMARTAVKLLLGTLDGKAIPTVHNLPTSIIVRKSVGPVKAG